MTGREYFETVNAAVLELNSINEHMEMLEIGKHSHTFTGVRKSSGISDPTSKQAITLIEYKDGIEKLRNKCLAIVSQAMITINQIGIDLGQEYAYVLELKYLYSKQLDEISTELHCSKKCIENKLNKCFEHVIEIKAMRNIEN